MAPRYLSLSEIPHIRRRASETLRRRRPRRAARVRSYVTAPGGDMAPLALAVRRYLTLGAA